MSLRLIAGSGLLLMACAQPALAQDADLSEERPWSLSLGGGVSVVSGGEDPWSSSIDLVRSLGDASLGIGYSRSADNGQEGVPLSLGSKSETFGISAGYGIGNVSLDIHGSYGVRRFDARSFRRRNGQVVTLDGKGKSYGIGATVSVFVPLSDRTSLSPYASVNHDSTDTARALVLPRLGLVAVKDKEKGTTGSFGASLDHRFGSEGRHSISANAAFVVTSNSAVTSRSITRRSGAVRPLRPQAGAGGSDNWFEYGASASFALSDMIDLSVTSSRTAGAPGPESTSLFTGVSFSF